MGDIVVKFDLGFGLKSSWIWVKDDSLVSDILTE